MNEEIQIMISFVLITALFIRTIQLRFYHESDIKQLLERIAYLEQHLQEMSLEGDLNRRLENLQRMSFSSRKASLKR